MRGFELFHDFLIRTVISIEADLFFGLSSNNVALFEIYIIIPVTFLKSD